jgi:peptide/nickel transport system permease protein
MTRRLRFAKTPTGRVGLILLGLVLIVALLGPTLAPHSISDPVGPPASGPGDGAPLGTDFLGRDVLSRVLAGGQSVLGLAGAATLLAYLAGLPVGLYAGLARSWLGETLMRTADILLAFPPILLLLVVATGTGASLVGLVVSVALIQVPLIVRLTRNATLEVSVRGYVEAAIARGERPLAILRREILPNVAPVILADTGLRFTASVLLIAAVNFLSLGLQPPSADWALLVSENREIISLNPLVILVPALLVAALTVSVSLLADAVARSIGTSTAGEIPR